MIVVFFPRPFHFGKLSYFLGWLSRLFITFRLRTFSYSGWLSLWYFSKLRAWYLGWLSLWYFSKLRTWNCITLFWLIVATYLPFDFVPYPMRVDCHFHTSQSCEHGTPTLCLGWLLPHIFRQLIVASIHHISTLTTDCCHLQTYFVGAFVIDCCDISFDSLLLQVYIIFWRRQTF